MTNSLALILYNLQTQLNLKIHLVWYIRLIRCRLINSVNIPAITKVPNYHSFTFKLDSNN